jgi:glycosyltransferase involved in cell wall biosynthesis
VIHRVLLAPSEVAGVAGAQRDALRRRGHRADLVVMAEHPFGFPSDRVAGSLPARAREGLRAPLRHDVLHWQFGTTLCEFVDAAWARAAGRPLQLMHYWGDDCRRLDVARARHPARARVFAASGARDQRTVLRRLRLAARVCHAALVSDLELASYVVDLFATVYVVPTPLGLPLKPVVDPPRLDGDGPVVLHAPSHAPIKGTREILAALHGVAARRPLRVRTVSGVPREQVVAELARADLVVDQLNSESPGIFALEAMALRRPVLLEFRRDALAPFAAENPAVAVTAQTLALVVERMCDDAQERERLGEAGRRYVAAVHDADLVAAALERVYAHARTAGPGLFEATAAGIRSLPFPP